MDFVIWSFFRAIRSISAIRNMNHWKYILGVLSLAVSLVWLAVITGPDDKLHIIACDVGQGDAILIQMGTNQILIDGGPDNKVLNCLGSNMPFWDRKIELVVLTHGDADHVTGLVEVFERYDVDSLLVSELRASTQVYQALEKAVGGREVRILRPAIGKEIRLGAIRLDMLWPASPDGSQGGPVTQSAGNEGTQVLGSATTNKPLNDFSVVLALRYRDFDALFTGDIGPKVSDQLAGALALNRAPGSGSWEYLKVPHHGSKNGLTRELLTAIQPQIAVISAGKENRWGHPHQEVIELLGDQVNQVLRTDLMGMVEVVTDGDKIWLK